MYFQLTDLSMLGVVRATAFLSTCMTTGRATRTDIEVIDVVDSFCLWGSIINSKGTSSQKIYCRIACSRPAVKVFETLRYSNLKVFKLPDVSIPIKSELLKPL